ncbi:type II secretion system protein N [Thiomicrorhabdus cannonii]|uniref:type II secretion system protein N n=1 Tax=Thiomicrorhabdus cannonii TaxID=2748011 RepID=UPI0015B7B226|nr:type II secretion system protein N [Thiomicrorhabdus cannonii]
MRQGIMPMVKWGGLTVLLTIFSLTYHLPAGWVAQQVALSIPKQLQLTMWQGRVWQGAVDVTWQTPLEKIDLGQLRWDFNPWALLGMQAETALQWSHSQGGAHTTVAVNILDKDLILISNLEGRLPLAFAAGLLPVGKRLGGGVEGTVDMDIDTLEWNAVNGFPQAIKGELALSGVNAMGIELPQLKLVPSMQNQQVVVALDGGAKAWRLNGEVRFDQQHHQANLTIKADSAEAMPAWTDLLMRKTSPIEAVLRQQGKWLK